MKRRTAVAAAVALGVPRLAWTRPRTIGWLTLYTRELSQPGVQITLDALARRGWRSGQEIALELRYAEHQIERLPALARELVSLGPDVLVATTNVSVQALQNETRDIPIVMVSGVSPVSSGLVASLSRPGGNVTGTTYNPLSIGGKAIELLHQLSPRPARITLVWNPDFPGMRQYVPYLQRTAERLKVSVTYVDVRKAEDFRPAAIAATRPDALYFPVDPVVVKLGPELMRLANEQKLPTLTFWHFFADGSALLVLEPDLTELLQHVAEYIDRILRGEKPATMPVREPSRFKLTVNMKTARSIGIAVPRELLLQASELIE